MREAEKQMMNLGLFLALGFCVWHLYLIPTVSGNAVFQVEHKFKGRQRSMTDFKDHDDHRHGRFLDDIDIPLGGDGDPAGSSIYFTKIRLGTPAKEMYVQIDTGSDMLWVNCAGCEKCPDKSDLGMTLTRFDPKGSSTSKTVTCDAKACSMIYPDAQPGCAANTPCFYKILYGDGSTSSGYFVQDYLYYDEVSGNLQTTIKNGTVVFGCGNKQDGQLSETTAAVDGLIGFGQASSSFLSQLAAEKVVKKMFSHCLDADGGGIFAIGEIAEPRLNTTPLIPDMPHYNVLLKSVEAGNDVVHLSIFSQAAIFDSGTTLAYIPDEIYDMIMKAIMTQQPKLSIFNQGDEFKCFDFDGNVDNGFPTIKLHFTESLILTVRPGEYLFDIKDNTYCIGWVSNSQRSMAGSNQILLGDIVLTNKLVLYDLENQALGWTDYNCSGSIKMKGDGAEGPSSLGSHDISSACRSVWGSLVSVLITVIIGFVRMGSLC